MIVNKVVVCDKCGVELSRNELNDVFELCAVCDRNRKDKVEEERRRRYE